MPAELASPPLGPTPAPGAAGDRRSRRKAQTRARLLESARQLFVERGYHATRPQDIAREADVAAGTFYTYFDDKRDAFLAFVEEAGDALLARMGSDAPENPDLPTLLSHALHQLMAYSDENPGVLAAAFFDPGMIDADIPAETTLRARLARTLGGGLARGMEGGRIHADYDPELVGAAVVGLIHQALIHANRSGLTRERVIEDMTRFCERALVPSTPE